MHSVNLNSNTSAAIVGWHRNGVAGYAIHDGDMWVCVGYDSTSGARCACRRCGKALRWLRETAGAAHFESLSDVAALPPLLESIKPEVSTRHDRVPSGRVDSTRGKRRQVTLFRFGGAS